MDALLISILAKMLSLSFDNDNNLKGKSDRPVSPCGICRQSFAEFQQRTKNSIRIILSGMEGKVHILENAAHLLPMVFSAEDLK